MCDGITSMRYAPPGRTSDVTSWPIQRRCFSGSTRKPHTVSGLAAIAISRSITTCSAVLAMLAPFFLFRLALQRLQPLVPELLEEGLQLDEPLRTRAVEAPGAVASLAHEPRLLQHAQMLRDRRSRQVEVRRDLTGRQLRIGNESENRPPVRCGDGFQRSLHGGYLSSCLR